MNTMGVGIIGCGNISAAYLRLAPMFRGIEIRAVADVDLNAANARAAEFGVRSETVDGLLEADDIDIVVNLTVPAAHFAVSSKILAADKHVYSQKPFVLSLDEGAEIKRLAAAGNLRVGSAPDTFLGGAHQQARQLIDDGTVGEVTSGTAFVLNHGMEAWHPNPDFFFLPGAGPVLDLGPYYVTNLVQLIGPVARVSALSSTPSKVRTILSDARKGEEIPVETPTTVYALLEFESGAVVTLCTSWDVWSHSHKPMELYGTNASLDVPDPNFFGGDLILAAPDSDAQAVAPWDHPFGAVNDGPHANYRAAGLADMALAILEGRAHRCSLELAHHVVDVMTGILASGESRRFVDMTTTCDRPDPLTPEDAAAMMVT